MNRFVGLSLMCLVFMSAQADLDEGKSEFKGRSWSLHMSQNGDEPIQVQSERKEYDRNGVTLHRKSQGIIDKDGIYKPIDEEGAENLFKKRSFFGRDQKEGEKRFNHEGGFKNQKKPPKKYNGFWKVLAYPFVKENNEDLQDQAFQKRRFHGLHPKFSGPNENDMEEKLSKRSRVSFYRPVEKMFENIFGSKDDLKEKQGFFEKKSSFGDRQNREIQKPPFEQREISGKRPHFWFKHGQKPGMKNPPFHQDLGKQQARPRPEKAEQRHTGRWFDDFERRQQAIWRQMRELEESFFGDFYGEEE